MTEHVLDLRPDGWTLLHPDDCDRRGCEVARAAEAGVPRPHPQRLGRHPCRVEDGRLVVDLDRNVWDAADRPDPALLPHGMSRPVDLPANTRREDRTALVRDDFTPWR